MQLVYNNYQSSSSLRLTIGILVCLVLFYNALLVDAKTATTTTTTTPPPPTDITCYQYAQKCYDVDNNAFCKQFCNAKKCPSPQYVPPDCVLLLSGECINNLSQLCKQHCPHSTEHCTLYNPGPGPIPYPPVPPVPPCPTTKCGPKPFSDIFGSLFIAASEAKNGTTFSFEIASNQHATKCITAVVIQTNCEPFNQGFALLSLIFTRDSIETVIDQQLIQFPYNAKTIWLNSAFGKGFQFRVGDTLTLRLELFNTYFSEDLLGVTRVVVEPFATHGNFKTK